MKRLLLLVVVLILYGSFYPWHFRHADLTASPLWILLHSWPGQFDRFAYRDIVVNIVLYVPFGMFGFLAIAERRSAVFASIGAVVAATLLSAGVEMTQLFEANRVCSMFDVICNVAGAFIGAGLAGSFPHTVRRAVSGIEAAGAFRLSGAIALLYLWLGYLLFPFFPALSHSALLPKLAVLLHPAGWGAQDFLTSLGGWLAAAALLDSLLEQRAAPVVGVALLLVPAKLLILNRTMSGSELAGALAGVACWVYFKTFQRPKLAAGALAVAALVAGGVLPFHFTAGYSQSFIWIPFRPLLDTPWDAAFVILLRKSFLYGSAIWLLQEGRRGWTASTLMVAIPLAVVEALQVFPPGRTPESTDPLLALLLGCGLMLLERQSATFRERVGA